MNERRLADGRVELVDTRRVEASPLYNHDLAPIDGGDDRDAARREATSPIVFASSRPGGAGGLDLWIACD